MNEDNFPYDFTLRQITYNNLQYKVALTPELYREEDGLDFTGSYYVLLIGSLNGTKMFELIPDAFKKWETEPAGIDPGIIDEIDKIIQEIRGI